MRRDKQVSFNYESPAGGVVELTNSCTYPCPGTTASTVAKKTWSAIKPPPAV